MDRISHVARIDVAPEHFHGPTLKRLDLPSCRVEIAPTEAKQHLASWHQHTVDEVSAFATAEARNAVAALAIFVHRETRQLQPAGQWSRQSLAFAAGSFFRHARPFGQ